MLPSEPWSVEPGSDWILTDWVAGLRRCPRGSLYLARTNVQTDPERTDGI